MSAVWIAVIAISLLGGDAQIAAGAQVAHHGMHGAGRPNDGIHRTGLDTLGTANAVRLVNYREHAGRLRFLCVAVEPC